MYILQS